MSAALVEASSKAEIASTVRAWLSALAQPGPHGRSRHRISGIEDDSVEVAIEETSLDLPEAATWRRSARNLGPGARQQPTSRTPRALDPSGTGARRCRPPSSPRWSAISWSVRRRQAPACPRPSRSPQITSVLPG